MRGLVLLCLVLLGDARAAALQRDLGQRLLYHRAIELPADLPASESARKQPLILDLRYARGDEAAAIATQAWLKFHASSRTPVFILANRETSEPLRAALAELRRTAGILIVGRAARNFEPDVPVQTSAEDERRAYDALAAGVPVATLLTDNPDKVRNDEASLSRDRVAEASAEAAREQASSAGPERPPVDLALQRAVHLHRALVALKKL